MLQGNRRYGILSLTFFCLVIFTASILVPNLFAQDCITKEKRDVLEDQLTALLKNTFDESQPGVFKALYRWMRGTTTPIPGAMLHVEAPELCFTWGEAIGLQNLEDDTPLRPEHPFRIASITKTFTAAAVLRLMEEKKLSLDDSIASHLPGSFIGLLEKDRYLVSQMTIRHLLTHTSGIHNLDNVFADAVIRQPHHRWTRLEQLQFAIEHGEPRGYPGQVYAYSDTGYLLLGEIIEQRTGTSMAEAFRELLSFNALGLKSTWLESLESIPVDALERAHQFWSIYDIYDWDPSMDLFGGGGLVSTVKELALFYRALFKKRIFKKPKTLDIMLQTVLAPDQGNYRMGIRMRRVDETIGWGHTGAWNTFVFYVPELDIAIAGSILQRNSLPSWSTLGDEALRLVVQAIH